MLLVSQSRSAVGGGTATSALVYGGFTPPYTAKTESWNGSSWTEVADINSIRGIMGGGGTSNTSQLTFGGYGGPPGSTRYANTQSWDGTSWTEVADLSLARSDKHSLPSASTANQLYAGGHTPPANYTTITEEWAEQPATSSFLTEGSIFLSGGTTLKGFGKAGGIPSATWASGS